VAQQQPARPPEPAARLMDNSRRDRQLGEHGRQLGQVSGLARQTERDLRTNVLDAEPEWTSRTRMGMGSDVVFSPAVGGAVPGIHRVWVGVNEITVPEQTDRYLKVMLDGSGCSWVASMPATQDQDAEVFDSYYTYGDIHLTGARAA
jgi:hypothetical protein